MISQEELFSLLLKALAYTPLVYKQSIFTTNQENFDNKFKLEYKFSQLPDDSILLFIPSVSSNDKPCKLVISIPSKANDDDTQYEYSEQEYDIVTETNDGTTRAVKKGDIIAFRMCIFRFRKTANQVILCNSPLYDDVIFSNAKITNCEFVNIPKIKDPQNENIEYTLITTKEYNGLLQRLSTLESKFLFGTEDPESALADRPAGTIYIKHEDD